ncbi:MAG: hypothetical protein ACO37E_13650, partial [Lutimaribacter sp.]
IPFLLRLPKSMGVAQGRAMTDKEGLNSDGHATQGGSAAKNLCHLWAPFCVAEKMGKGLGRGALLLGPLPGRAPPISFEGQSIRRIFWKKLKELRDNW